MPNKPVRLINARLRELRNQTDPHLSLQDVCDALGLRSREAYGYYEYQGGFRGERLPEELARKIATLFARRRVDPAEVLILAGISGDELPPEEPRLSGSERVLLERYRSLNTPRRRQIAKLLEALAREQGHPN